MNRLLITSFMIFLFCTSAIYSQNLLPGDTSFEAGPTNWLGGKCTQSKNAPHGQHVLTLNRAYNHSGIFYDLIQPNQPYTLTLSARSTDHSAQATLQIRHVKYGQVGKTLKMPLTSKWQSFSLKLPPQPEVRDVYFTIKQPDHSNIQIDSLHLTPSSQSLSYHPKPEYVVSITPTDAPENILFDDEPLPQLTTGFVNQTNHIQTGKLVIRTVG